MRDMDTGRAPPLTYDEVAAMTGRLDEAIVAAIIDTGATRGEVLEALAWAAQESDIMGEERNPLSGVVERVYALIVGDDEFPEDR